MISRQCLGGIEYDAKICKCLYSGHAGSLSISMHSVLAVFPFFICKAKNFRDDKTYLNFPSKNRKYIELIFCAIFTYPKSRV